MLAQALSPSPGAPGIPPLPEQSAILCQGLTKTYGEVQALVDLDLCVPYGSIFGFLGRNGAGKTTTMRLLAGLAQPTAGRAWVAGLETTSMERSARANFGYLPQNPAFYSWMSGREYLEYIAKIQALDPAKRKRQIAELLALSGLEEAAKRRIGGYSGGMIQRLGIAQALVGNPPVLLLDEPTSALDPAGRSEVLEMIAGLRGKVTVFLCSHILTDIERVCDTVAVLHKGCLVLVSDREALLAQYAVNAAELELANSIQDSPALADFQSALQAMSWVSNLRQEGSVLRVMVQDVPRGKLELMPLVVAHGLVLERYEWVRPSLEDIFLQLST
jgi:ABC-2 type transport system ATP-binding protein